MHQQSSHSQQLASFGPVLSRQQQWAHEEQQRLMLEVQELERQAIVAEAAVAAVAQVGTPFLGVRQHVTGPAPDPVDGRVAPLLVWVLVDKAHAGGGGFIAADAG